MPNNNLPKTGSKQCFVCGETCNADEISYNPKVHLPVCARCKGQKEEAIKEKEHLLSLGDGFTVGCIS